MKFLSLFCQGYAYALTTIEFCIILNIITKFNKIDYKRKRFFSLQILIFILICFSLCYFNIEINNFIAGIIGLIVVFLNTIIYNEVLEN